MYHYTECGLDNVHLKNGYISKQHPVYGEIYTVEDAEGLHKVIGQELANAPRTLIGKEIKFLRKELNFAQKHLAEILDVDEQTVGRWERDEVPIPRGNELVLRTLYLEGVCNVGKIRDLVEKLGELDTKINMMLSLERNEEDWKLSEAA